MPKSQFTCPRCQSGARLNFVLEDGTIMTTDIGSLVCQCHCGMQWPLPAVDNISKVVN